MKRALVLAISSVAAAAEANAQGFAVNRYQPAPAGDAFFSVPSAGEGAPGLHAAVGADYAHAPLVLRSTPERRDMGAIVSGQLNLHAGLSLSVARRALVSLDVPAAIVNRGDSPATPDARIASPGSAALGDLRAGLRVRLYGERALALAAGASLWLPTGSQAQYTGDGQVRPALALLAGGRGSRLLWAATTGIERRTVGDLVRSRMAQVLTAAAAVGALFADGGVLVGPELSGATALDGGGPRATNLEALLGLHLRGEQLAFGVGAGPGLSVGTGTPDVRIVASAAYSGGPPPAPPPHFAHAPDPPAPARPAAPRPATAPAPPPRVSVTQTEVLLDERIEFEPGSARLRSASTELLTEVARVMSEHVEIQRVEIEGYTDARERTQSGLELAKQRADAVRDWLIARGIPPERLAARAYGRARPAAGNDTEEGRSRNRRVEFRIVNRPPEAGIGTPR
jgi:outer membrane protein OmpA-like peptidoglycan-associated protein